MKKKLVIANWKMNPPTLAEARILFSRTKRTGVRMEKIETVICPPHVYLSAFANSGNSRVALGAQNVHQENGARATGEISPEMLRDLGVSYVIVGHSERRARGEADEVVAKKTLAVLKEGMKAVLCVGENERDEEGRFYDVLKNQIKSSLASIQKKYLHDLIIAYEPVWAIGKSARDAMTPRDIRETSIFIKKVLSDIYDPETSALPPILYGGSVEASNADAIVKDAEVQGLLVGNKSLSAEEFGNILRSVESI